MSAQSRRAGSHARMAGAPMSAPEFAIDDVLRVKGAPDDPRRFVVAMSARGAWGTLWLRDDEGMFSLSTRAAALLLERAE